VRSKTVTQWLFVGIVLLHLLNIVAQSVRLIFHVHRRWWLLLLDVDAEANLPTWFSSVLLLTASVYSVQKRERTEMTDQQLRRGWGLMSVLLLAFSADEVARVHEQIAAKILPFLKHQHIAREWLWALGAAIVVVMGIVILPFLRALPHKLRNELIGAGVIFVTGGLILEAIGHAYASRYGWSNIGYVSLSALEELLEMLGVLRYIHVVGRSVES
jgi:hypothetical protein